DVAQLCKARTADLVGSRLSRRIRLLLYTVGGVRSVHVWHGKIDIPVRVGRITQPEGDVAIDGLLFDLTAVRTRDGRIVDDLGRRGGTGSTAQLVLVDVVILKRETKARRRRIAGSRVGTQRTPARGASPGGGGARAAHGPEACRLPHLIYLYRRTSHDSSPA